jgi:WD40 repeat protein
MASGAPIGGPITAHTDGVNAVAITERDGRPVIVSGGYDSTIRMWDLATGAPVGQPIPTFEYSVDGIVIAQLDDRPILVSVGGAVRVWELATGDPIGPALTGPTDVAMWDVAVAELDGDPVIVATGSKGGIRTWGP